MTRQGHTSCNNRRGARAWICHPNLGIGNSLVAIPLHPLPRTSVRIDQYLRSTTRYPINPSSQQRKGVSPTQGLNGSHWRHWVAMQSRFTSGSHLSWPRPRYATARSICPMSGAARQLEGPGPPVGIPVTGNRYSA